MVCVCNYTYCDDLDPIVKQPKDTVVLFQSGKSGDRFKKSKLKFRTVHSNQTNVNITIDRTKKLQKIVGFGGAFTDAGGININSLPINMAANIMKDYFSVHGLEYSVGRIPIAGTDFSERTYSYDDVENDEELKHFALAKEDLYHKVNATLHNFKC